MTDQRIQYNEEMVGAGHPTKADTLNRLVLVEHNTDGTHNFDVVMPGYITGLTPSYKDADEITISSGGVEIGGVKYTLSASIDKAFTGILGTSKRHFLFVHAPASGTALDAGCFTVGQASSGYDPTWNDTYLGWYGNSGWEAFRCIGSFRTDISGNIVPFTLSAGWQFDNIWSNNTLLDTSTATGAKTALSCQVPTAFGSVHVLLRGAITGSNDTLYMTHGVDTTAAIDDTYKYLFLTANKFDQIFLLTDASGQVYYHTVGTIALKIYQVAWKLPPGLAGAC